LSRRKQEAEKEEVEKKNVVEEEENNVKVKVMKWGDEETVNYLPKSFFFKWVCDL
jgi:hypothetical protein